MARTTVHALDRMLPFAAPAPSHSTRSASRPAVVAGLRFALPRSTQADAHVLDLSGNRVRTLACGELGPGEHECTWDGLDEAGAPCAAGNYVLRLESDGSVLTSRIVALA